MLIDLKYPSIALMRLHLYMLVAKRGDPISDYDFMILGLPGHHIGLLWLFYLF